ncbi:histidine phosphatase family protein [Thiomicrospira microaerophila]|uniref:histidine phosphatase family protein n=1 Tax=Thiomicrospira microaerophila TaxID=406020 RepID=UPI000698C66E|nr:histidine phosphatase family protein [Thiomicrospira microaerophila]
MKYRLTWVLFIGICLFRPVWADDEFKAVVTADRALIEQVRQGGYVIYMRHGKTDTAQPDQVPIDLNDCTTQRPLSKQGLDELHLIASYFKQLYIPYTPVHSSPLCRAKQTAEIVFGSPVIIEENLQYTAALTTREKQPIIERTRALLSKPVAKGTNRVLVAHGPNLVEMMSYFPPEGSIVFFRPLGAEGFAYLATITPQDWSVLLK